MSGDQASVVIGLTEILADRGLGHGLVDKIVDRAWGDLCAEFYRRYGHLRLWSKPPALPSPETKQLIAESLRRRQEQG
jgi:hypothetical protein